MVDSREAPETGAARRRWPLAMVLLGTLLLVSLLLLPVRETEVELDLLVSEIGFALSRLQALSGTTNLSELGVSGIRGARQPGMAHAQLSSHLLPSARAIRITRGGENGEHGTVTLAPISLPAGARVRITETDSRSRRRLSLDGADPVLRVTLHGPVRFEQSGSAPQTIDFERPASLLLDLDAGGASLDLGFAEGSRGGFSAPLFIEDLSLSRIDELTEQNATLVQRVSTVRSGALYFESLGGEEHGLRPGELLRFGESRGIIRTLQLEDDDMRVAFRGTVRDMRSGWSESPRSLMPTYLEWLRARHLLSLLWGTTLYLFGLIVAVLKWWRYLP